MSTPVSAGLTGADEGGGAWRLGGALLFVAVAVFIDPLRETALDDDWAYTLTVKNLLETGQYRAHDWLSANILFQAHWGALFAKLFGFSHGILRLSTVVLLGGGLLAFHGLAREHGLRPRQAGITTLALMGSPLILQFGFNFMSDVPFVAVFVMAALGYTRGIARGRASWMLAGGVAASAAILTRQFGVSLIVGLAVAWLFDGQRVRRLPLYALAAALPVAATIWQFRVGTLDPPWASGFSVYALAVYFDDLSRVLLEAAWRPTAALHYLAMFSLPFLGLGALGAVSAWRRGLRPGRRDIAIVAGLAGYLVVGFWVGHEVLGFRRFMPFLPWNYTWMHGRPPLPILLTVVTTLGGLGIGWALVRRYWGPRGWTGLAPEKLFLDAASFALLGGHLIFFQLGDQYLLGLVPFTLILLGLRIAPVLDRHPRIALSATLAMLLVSAVWVRGILVHEEARWAAAEAVHDRGVPHAQIYGSWMWNSYYGFPEWLVEIDYDYATADGFRHYFQRWLPGRKQHARYQVVVLPTPTPPAPERGEIAAAVPFRDVLFRPRTAYTLERATPEPAIPRPGS